MIAAFNFFHATAAGGGTPYALQFDLASSQTVTADDTGLPSGTSARSIALWFKSDGVGELDGAYQGLLKYGNYFNVYLEGYGGYGSVNVLADGPFGNQAYPSSPAPDCTDGNWHHAVATYSHPTCKIWIDGVDVTDPSSSTFSGMSTSLVGAGGLEIAYQVMETFDGTIDDVRIYDIALDSTQIGDLYNSGNGTNTDPVGGGHLVRWYKFDEGTGTTAADDGSNDEDGTLENGPTWVTGKV